MFRTCDLCNAIYRISICSGEGTADFLEFNACGLFAREVGGIAFCFLCSSSLIRGLPVVQSIAFAFCLSVHVCIVCAPRDRSRLGPCLTKGAKCPRNASHSLDGVLNCALLKNFFTNKKNSPLLAAAAARLPPAAPRGQAAMRRSRPVLWHPDRGLVLLHQLFYSTQFKTPSSECDAFRGHLAPFVRHGPKWLSRGARTLYTHAH